MSEITSLQLMTLEEFEERLLEGDRWVELVNGRFSRLNPPDDAHGDVVRNLARSLAAYLKKSKDTYACFELPLIVQKEGPTVRCPAVSCFRFQPGSRFAETDKVLSETRPELTIEIASTNERRETMSERVRAYLEWGVTAVWVVDPVERHVHQFHGQNAPQLLKETQVLPGHPVMPGFSIPISDLFRQPKWMTNFTEVL
jgi:Uma2 family endonuclease